MEKNVVSTYFEERFRLLSDKFRSVKNLSNEIDAESLHKIFF